MKQARNGMDHIEVEIWGQVVGQVRLDPGSGFYGMEYAPSWLEQTQELAPLTMPKREGFHLHSKLSPATWHRLPGWVAGALPDDFGTTLTRAWLNQNNRTTVGILDHLGAMGDFSMGALTFNGGQAPDINRQCLNIETLVDAANRVVNGQMDDIDPAMVTLMGVGAIAGGQRAKIVVGWNEATHEFSDGRPAHLPEGFTPWLVKFDGVMPHSKDGSFEPGSPRGKGRVEYAYYLMAQAAGLEIMESRLLHEQGRAHFMTRRFDRNNGQRRHIVTLCDMAHLDYKAKGTHTYDSLFDVLARLELGEQAKRQIFARMCFNAMARNQDDHTKNFSFMLDHAGSWSLAPAYDLTYANNPHSEWVCQHLLGINGKFKRIGRDDLRAVGQRWNVEGINQVLDTVSHAIQRWPEFAEAAGMNEKSCNDIGTQHLPMLPGGVRRKVARGPTLTRKAQ